MNFHYTVTDPAGVTEPVKVSRVLLRELDRPFVDEPCDPEYAPMALH